MRGGLKDIALIVAVAIFLALLILLFQTQTSAQAACRPAPEINPEWYPTNCVGDVAYGHGLASGWSGRGVARNDCTYPWATCTPIRITYQGRSVDVVPTMYCDCWRGLAPGQTGPAGERPRLVDLDLVTREALGMTGFRVWHVTVCPIEQPATGEQRGSLEGCHSATTPSPVSPLPDTAMP